MYMTGTWFIVGGKLINGDPVPVITVNGVSSVKGVGPESYEDPAGTEVVYGAYFRENIDAAPVEPEFDLENAIVGHFVGCRETAGPSIMYWGTTEDYNGILQNGHGGTKCYYP